MKIFDFKILGLILFFSFFIGLSAQATNQLDVIQYTSTGTNNYAHPWGQTWKPTQNNISGINAVFSNGTSNAIIDLYVCAGVPDYANIIATANCTASGNTLLYHGSNLSVSPQANYLYFSPVGATIGGDYYFSYYLISGTLDVPNGGGTPYADGHCFNEFGSCGATVSLVFATYYDDEYVAPTGWTITGHYPLTGFAMASTSIQFITSLTKPSDKEGYMEIKLYPDNIITYANEIRYPYGRIGGTSTSTRWTIQTEALIDGNYSWYASLSDYDTGITMATSTLESFSVGVLGTLNFANPLGLTEEDICIGVATSTIMGSIECAFKKVAAWIIYPSQTSVANLYTAYQELRASFPFNAFFGLTDALQGAIATTTLTTTDNFSLPMITATGTFYMLPVVNSSTLANLIGQTNATLFRNSISWFLWLAVALMIFIQVRSL